MASLVIRNVHLAAGPDDDTVRQLFTVVCTAGVVSAVIPSDGGGGVDALAGDERDSESVDGEGGLLIPSLCHAHIHLDKCYLLDRCTLTHGDFAEALAVTAHAKAAFAEQPDDLYARGARLVRASVAAGVTAMRAHVEVDTTVRTACLAAGARLQAAFAHLCDVQLCVFAQDPLFADAAAAEPGENYALLAAAAAAPHVAAVGSAPYVERTAAHAHANIRAVLALAHAHALHADFHLDYTLDVGVPPLVWALLAELRARVARGAWAPGRRVCVGHATRLTLFGPAEWARLRDELAGLPVTLVGLPQSDVYMMGRGLEPPPRGTLDAVRLQREHGIEVAMAVNNVQNAFTPQGAPDPLALCPLGVALFQAAAPRDCATLLRAVTTTAREAIGEPARHRALMPQVGDPADFVVLHGNDSVQSAVCSPAVARTTVKAGRVVSRRRVETTFLGA